MRYISDGHSLPEVICKWLETESLQNEYKIFISDNDLEAKKLNILINCLKMKGTFYNLIFLTVLIFFTI